MEIKEAIYCMESYLPESSEHCKKCRYYGINIGEEGERYCMSSEAHRMAILALKKLEKSNQGLRERIKKERLTKTRNL